MSNGKTFPSLIRTRGTRNQKFPVSLKSQKPQDPSQLPLKNDSEVETVYQKNLASRIMAKFLSSLPTASPNYRNGLKYSSQIKFPSTPSFQGFHKPCRFEGEILDLEVSGSVPLDMDGTFFRMQPDHRFPPLYYEDPHFNGDGSISAFHFHNGHVDFKQRYVRTDRFKEEAKARRALFGRYRNMYTDHELVKGVIRTTANENVVFWRGILLALGEEGPPFAVDPETLETIGRYDFEGQVLSPTFTSHPKIDPVTGEMVGFAYEAGGNGCDASRDIVVYTIDKDGKKTEECWYKAPFSGMIHDCGLTDNYVVLPLTPLKISLSRLKRGGNHFAWDPKEDQLYGIVPRRGGKPEDVVWLRATNGRLSRFLAYDDNANKKLRFSWSYCWML